MSAELISRDACMRPAVARGAGPTCLYGAKQVRRMARVRRRECDTAESHWRESK